MATPFFCPTNTTSRLPRVTPVGKLTKFERPDNGEQRTTQVLQLDTAEQYYFELLSQLGEPGVDRPAVNFSLR
jgi:hypothetical protein